MPIPSVEPMPLPPTLSRLAVPDDAQEASYLAASARMASFWRVSSWGTCSLYVPMPPVSSAKSGDLEVPAKTKMDVGEPAASND